MYTRRMAVKRNTNTPDIKPEEVRAEFSVDRDGALHIKGTLRSQVDITGALNADITGWPCDGLMFSANTTASVQLAEDAAPVSAFYVGGVWHPVAARKVVSVTGGVSVTAGWQRKPA